MAAPRRTGRRFVAAASGGVALLAVTGVAAAAGFGVSSTSLGAGSTTVAPCQSTGPIAASYTAPGTAASDIADTGAGYVLRSVTLGGINSTCFGKTVYVTVVEAGTAKVLGSGSASISAASTQVSLTPTSGSIPVGGTSNALGVTQLDVLIPN